LNVITITLPPLRDRPGDVRLLADHFVQKYSESNGVPARPISADAMSILKSQKWPGNVRELENTIHRAVLLATGDEIGRGAFALPTTTASGTPTGDASGDAAAPQLAGDATAALVGRTVADVERDLIIDTLKHCFGNRTHAANILGISIRTLRNKLKLYNDEGMPVPGPGSGSGNAMANPS
jgi:two-component system response regulator FlrC